MTIRLKSTQGYETLIDEKDFEKANHFKWYPLKKKDKVYAVTNFKKDGKIVHTSLHRLLMNPKKGLQVDHINRDGLDNRRHNLRICTNSENSRNSIKKCSGITSKYKGVHRAIVQKPWGTYVYWVGCVQIGRKQVWRRYFKGEFEAARGYDAKAREIFGEFARTNFPLEISKDYDDSPCQRRLSNETAIKIREEYKVNKILQKDYKFRRKMALKYNVHPNTIKKIIYFRTHKI